MRIGVDARSLTGGRGVSRYTSELLRALVQEYPNDRWVLFVPGRAPAPGARSLAEAPNVELRRHPLPSRALFGFAALTGRPRIDRLLGGSLDLLWAPAPAPLAVSGEVPFVLTVHDLSFELRPQDFTAYERLWHRLARPRSLGRRAARVITDSEATREELVSQWGVGSARVRVVELGVRIADAVPDGAAIEATLRGFGLQPGGYLLAVGALEPRKGCELLMRAFGSAHGRGLKSQLVFAGEGRLAPQLSAPGVRLLGRVGDDELDALYRGARALVVASFLEGYCLPVREALARATPVLASDLPVFGAELSAGLLRFPVGDQAALAEAMLRIAGDDELRRGLGSAGHDAVAGLSWERTARATRAVLAEAAGLG